MRKNSWIGTAGIGLALLLVVTGCQTQETQESSERSSSSSASAQTTVSITAAAESTVPTLESLVTYDEADRNEDYRRDQSVVAVLSGTSGTISGQGASIAGSTLTISTGGDYLLEGDWQGNVVVDAPKNAVVRLILNGVQIRSGDGPAIRIDQCKKTVLLLPSGSQNSLTDGETYSLDDGADEPDAAVYSKDDLTILGSGECIVNARYRDAIKCKDDLLLLGGTLRLSAADDGIIGRDLLVIDGASVTVECQSNGLKTTNEDTDKGVLVVHSGSLNIVSNEDGLQSAGRLYLLGGSLDITAGGGAAELSHAENDGFHGQMPGFEQESQSESNVSQKGIKAVGQLTIAGGETRVSALDDAVHTNGHLLVQSGKLTLASGDDGIHADGSLTVSGGNLEITQSYEGLEGAQISITGGETRICASDDGINAANGQSTDRMGRGPMEQTASSNEDIWIRISGGLVVVDAQGDGLDSNGSIVMSDGLVLVDGPTSGGNGALDYESVMNVDGGILIAVGSMGMAEPPSNTSKQCALAYGWPSAQGAGTLVSLADEDGNILASFAPKKQFQWICISMPSMKSGENVILQLGGVSSGQSQDGWYGTAAVEGVASQQTILLSQTVTSAGQAQGGMGGMGDRKPGGMGGPGGMMGR